MGSHNVWVNNIGVADPVTNPWNRAINNVATNGYVNEDVRWYHNITFNRTPGQASVLSDYGTPSVVNGNLLGLDPLLASPIGGDFHPKPGSPAIDAGTPAFGLGSTDMDGQGRVKGAVDIGVYEAHSGAATASPGAEGDPASVPR
jgi:hypothetical protein